MIMNCDDCGKHIERLELALHRIAGHGNITGQQARAIAADAVATADAPTGDIVRHQLIGIIDHWREFGDMTMRDKQDYGIGERIEAAAKLLGR